MVSLSRFVTQRHSPHRPAGPGMLSIPHDHPAPPTRWRIDDLAHRAGVTVDTVRYYQREGLCPRAAGGAGQALRAGPPRAPRPDPGPPGARVLAGRHPGAARQRPPAPRRGHLRRPGRGRGLLPRGPRRALRDRRRTSARRCAAGGLLLDPTEYGRDAYDGEDLDLLRTMAELAADGHPDRRRSSRWAASTPRAIESMQRAVLDALHHRRHPGVGARRARRVPGGLRGRVGRHPARRRAASSTTSTTAPSSASRSTRWCRDRLPPTRPTGRPAAAQAARSGVEVPDPGCVLPDDLRLLIVGDVAHRVLDRPCASTASRCRGAGSRSTT